MPQIVLWPWLCGSWIYNYLCNQCLSQLMLWVRISIRARYTILCDKVCDRSVVFSGSSTNKTDRHDITEILLKVALNSIKQTQLVPYTLMSTRYILPDQFTIIWFILLIFAMDLRVQMQFYSFQSLNYIDENN